MGQSFIEFVSSHLDNVPTDTIADWMRNGGVTTDQYRGLQAELIKRKTPVDKNKPVVSHSPQKKSKVIKEP